MNTIYNILIVEDDEEIKDAVEIYLRNQGYKILKLKMVMKALKL